MVPAPLPAADDVDTGLFLLREIAGSLSLNDTSIDGERGVILGEERLRDTPGTHEFKAWSNDVFPNQRYSDRLPIGLVPVIKTAKHDTFADLYANFYRPDLETLIVVGDVDPKAIEAQIKAMNCNYMGIAFHFGALTMADVKRSMTLFAAEVMAKLPKQAAAAE